MLLRFRVANHRSIRDEATLSMVGPSMRGATPPDGDWRRATLRVAGIYGANAAGKSTVLDALGHMVTLVQHSATTWAERNELPYAPFALDAAYRDSPSLYELDFTLSGVRYTFGFRMNRDGIVEEWLYSYPTGKKRVLYERTGDEFTFGRSLSGDNVRIGKVTRPTSLFLSTAANNRHRVLAPIQDVVAQHIRYARFDDLDRRARLRWIIELMDDENALRAASALLGFADFGINSIEVHDEPTTDEVKAVIRAVLVKEVAEDTADDILRHVQKQFRFIHAASDQSSSEPVKFTLNQESAGTVAWLSLAVPALHAVRMGDTLLVDEIDSSLHPTLTAELIGMFKDPETNGRGAQLIFTSHDTSLLGSLHGDILDADEVWLTEKAPDGSTDLYSLAEFPVRARDNLERRYLHGRYGGVPTLTRAALREVFAVDAAPVAS